MDNFTIFTFIAIVFAFYIEIRTFMFVNKRFDSNSWPSVMAEVSDIIIKRKQDPEDGYFNQIYLQLTYLVDDTEFTKEIDTEIRTFEKPEKNHSAYTLNSQIMKPVGIRLFPIGTEYELWFDPAEPQRSSMYQGMDELGDGISTLSKIVLFFVGIFITVDLLVFQLPSIQSNILYSIIELVLYVVLIVSHKNLMSEYEAGRQEQGKFTKNLFKEEIEDRKALFHDTIKQVMTISNTFPISSKKSYPLTCNVCGTMLKYESNTCKYCGNIVGFS